MTKITIKWGDKNLAEGIIGKNVQIVEGNYYFDKEVVKLDWLAKKPDAYTCPIKRSTCDYYFLKTENGEATGTEVAWIYEIITNSIFSTIEGKVGMYATNKNALEVIKSEE